jgi:hypothetical protein
VQAYETMLQSISTTTSLIVGFHPDQATDAVVDLALMQRLPFAVCPCCVFSDEFPERVVAVGGGGGGDLTPTEKVTTYSQLVQYLKQKHPNIQTTNLTFDTGGGLDRNTVLYTRSTDYLN